VSGRAGWLLSEPVVGERGSERGGPASAQGGPRDEPVGVMTVDDQPVFRDLARLVLQTTPGFRSVGELASGEEALAMIDELRPQLALVDVRMPGIGGIETARRIASAHPEIVVVLVSAMLHGASPPRAARLWRALGVSRRTLGRWRTWWRKSFGQGRFFKSLRGLLRAPVDAATLPLSLLGAVEGRSLWGAALAVLKLLRPLSSATAAGSLPC